MERATFLNLGLGPKYRPICSQCSEVNKRISRLSIEITPLIVSSCRMFSEDVVCQTIDTGINGIIFSHYIDCPLKMKK